MHAITVIGIWFDLETNYVYGLYYGISSYYELRTQERSKQTFCYPTGADCMLFAYVRSYVPAGGGQEKLCLGSMSHASTYFSP